MPVLLHKLLHVLFFSQEISEGVRSSARAVRAAEDGLRRIGSAASKGEHDPICLTGALDFAVGRGSVVTPFTNHLCSLISVLAASKIQTKGGSGSTGTGIRS